MRTYLEALVRRHRALDRAIAQATRRRGSNSIAVMQMKRLRLAIKDRIVTLRSAVPSRPA